MKQMHSMRPSLLRMCAAVALTLGSGAVMAGSEEAPGQIKKAGLETDRLIVKYRDAVTDPKGGATAPALGLARKGIVDRAGQQFGLTVRQSHGIATGAHVFKLSKKVSVDEAAALAAELAARDPSVEYAEPDRIMVPLATPTDPRYGEQWHYFENTGGLRLPTAWDKSTGSGVNVAVIDTGSRPHADMSGQLLPGYDFITDTWIANDGNGRDSDASDPGDAVFAGECGGGQPASDKYSSWHGTHVAGTVAARSNNGVGVAGVAYNAKVVPVRVLGKCGGYTSDIADAIIWSSGGAVYGVPANANKARVINLSLGGGGSCSTTTQNAINSARSRGSVIVVAAGNSNTNVSNSNPANCAGVVAVAATGRSGGRAPYSNYGTLVDVAAPGGDGGGGVLSTLNTGLRAPVSDSYAYYQGTSMATPHVAGVAALMLSRNPSLTPDQVESKLKSTARAFPVACSGCGTGIVDANAAVISAGGTTTSGLAESESNNTTGTADAVTTPGSIVTGNMGSTSDTDYFKVMLPAGKAITVTLTPGSSTANYDLYLYNSTGSIVSRSTNGAGLTDTVINRNGGSVTYARYARVIYKSGGTGSTSGKYSLKFSW